MKIIGLGAYSRVGKDTTADLIVKKCQNLGLTAKKLPLAWKLKQICRDLYAWDGMQDPEFYDTPNGEKYRDIKLPTLNMTPVEVWVAMGTPAIRACVYQMTWVDYILKTDHGVDVLIVPDVRFPNEVEAFHNHNAKLVKVVREGYGPRDTVPDQALIGYDGWDLWIGGTMRDLDIYATEITNWCTGRAWPSQTQIDVNRLKSMEKV